MKFIYALFFSLIFSFISNAQQIECGTNAAPDPIFFQEYYQYKTNFKRSSASTLLYVPITAHIVRTTAGTGGLTVTELYDAIGIMNTYYINSNIQFYICNSINYIDNSLFYDFDNDDEGLLANNNDVANTINIYFTNTIVSNGSGLCGYAYYPGGPDRILMANDCTKNGSTLSHEMGHFFHLPHTHGGGGSPDEYVNGSNCSSAGDFICDTPADPTLNNNSVNTACVYVGSSLDPNGDPYQPEVRNIMSYSRKNCRDLFSAEQYEIIEYSSLFERNYFTCPSFSITPVAFSNNSICPGENLTIDYLVANNFNAGNIFTAQLSNQFGVFSNPTTIGSITATTSGTINATIPAGLSIGQNYRIRIVASNPVTESPNNGVGLSVPNSFSVNFINNVNTQCVYSPSFNLSGGSPIGGIYLINGIESSVFNPSALGVGTHNVVYSYSNGCETKTASSNIVVDVCASVNETSIKNNIILFPNPANEQLTIKLNGQKLGESYQVRDITGKILKSGVMSNESNPIEIKDLTKGLYFIQIGNQNPSVLKFVKQ